MGRRFGRAAAIGLVVALFGMVSGAARADHTLEHDVWQGVLARVEEGRDLIPPNLTDPVVDDVLHRATRHSLVCHLSGKWYPALGRANGVSSCVRYDPLERPTWALYADVDPPGSFELDGVSLRTSQVAGTEYVAVLESPATNPPVAGTISLRNGETYELGTMYPTGGAGGVAYEEGAWMGPSLARPSRWAGAFLVFPTSMVRPGTVDHYVEATVVLQPLVD